MSTQQSSLRAGHAEASRPLSATTRVGLVVLGALSLVDLAGPLLTNGKNPPMSVAWAGCALGLLSLVCIGYAWRGVRRAVVPLVALRLLSALTALPAFLVGGVPAAAVVAAAAIVVLTLLGVALVLGGGRTQAVTR